MFQWRNGDFIITDNLAVGHKANAETQLPVEEIGLRIMHRTTIQGKHVPQKAGSRSQQFYERENLQKDEF